jgi:hypothetical protein
MRYLVDTENLIPFFTDTIENYESRLKVSNVTIYDLVAKKYSLDKGQSWRDISNKEWNKLWLKPQ